MTDSTEAKSRIVVGADFSQTGDHALRHAVQLAKKWSRVQLHITHVIPAPQDLHDAKRIAALSTELRAKLDKLREHVTTLCAPPTPEETFTLETVFHVRLGEPAAALHQVAVDVDADLIVVGTHGRRGMERLILGSVAQELISTAHLPVLVAHPKALDGMRKSERPDPPRPGVSVHDTGLSDHLHLEFVPRSQHISGMI